MIRKTVPDLRPFPMARMLGYGKFHYRYPTGREGESALISLADRAGGLSLYVNSLKGNRYLPETNATRLAKADVGRSCIRFKRLDDLDRAALIALVREAQTLGGAGLS